MSMDSTGEQAPAVALPPAIGPYRVLRQLGAGGMARVLLAEAHGASGFTRQVALKLLLPELAQSARMQRLLIEEARLSGQLSHRNLVQVHDLALSEGAYYLRMDYVDGGDLRRLTRAAPLPLALCLLVAEEVVLALQYLHLATDAQGRPLGLIHRDVSPANILISCAGEVKLADLGVAKATLLADVTQVNVLKGKYAYMSPEQVTGEPLTASSDQFGLGVTLYQLLRGRLPFTGDTPLATMEQVREARPPDVADLDPGVGRLLLRCLAREPARRFADDEALRQALASCRARHPAAPLDLARWASAARRP